MLERLRARLTYANVMATLAVFIALGGSSYAAVTISGSTIKKRSIAGTKLKRNTLAGAQIRESRLALDLPAELHALPVQDPAAVHAQRADRWHRQSDDTLRGQDER